MSAKPALAFSQINFAATDFTSLWATSACLLTADFVALSAVYWLTVIGRSLFSPSYDLAFYLELYPAILLFLTAFCLQGLYPGLLLHPAEEIRRVFYCITIVFMLIGSSTFLWRNASMYSRSIFLITWVCGAPTILLARHAVRSLLCNRPWWGIPAVVLGSGSAAQRVAFALKNRRLGVRVVGMLTEGPSHLLNSGCPPVLGTLSAAPQLAMSRVVHYGIVAMPSKPHAEVHYIIQNFCRGFRHVLLIPDLPGICSLGLTARELGGEVGLEVPQRLFHPSSLILKRTLDFVISASIVLVLLPLLLIISVVIKCTSKGSVLYGHTRYGRNGKSFNAYKFRTMVNNGDQILTKHFDSHPEQYLEWKRDQKLRSDPRVTPIGKLLRRYSLDELPQLLNVLLGQMSLVGPRPIVKSEIGRYGPGYDLYTRVLPGITGLWQVSGRNNTSYEERIGYDEYYVRNWSIWLDAYILARTCKVVLTAEGAY